MPGWSEGEQEGDMSDASGVNTGSIVLTTGGVLVAAGSALAWGAVGLDASGLQFGRIDIGAFSVGEGAVSLATGVAIAAFGVLRIRHGRSDRARTAMVALGLVIVGFAWLEWTRVASAAFDIWTAHSTWTSYLGEAPGIGLYVIAAGGLLVAAAALARRRQDRASMA
jgi:hypothetical protein